ncbi:hypothetical protein FF38_07483 [Lucilia cuprina]|uniref:Uncharacterized protein n=1 Tax=Lucilia cuprina TaxID=7375 RepID=A0A0L0CPH2_LUCCU|nr:hypothetical protein CVS40_3165 [Lucilia cuprina]KNC34161.1 hypothetical protein FF38_07483 [Lucilia cuprina]
MACIDSDKFSANDLALFIESMEQISRMESLKRQRQQKNRALNLVDTLRYLDQQYTSESSSTLTSSDVPEEESIMESFEEKYIGYNSTGLEEENQYYAVDYSHEQEQQDDALSCHTTLYSMPYDCVASTKLDDCDYEILDFTPNEEEQLTHHQYEEPSEVIKSTKTKRKLSLFGLVRKKYKKCFSSKGNIWHKSDSWTKLSVL